MSSVAPTPLRIKGILLPVVLGVLYDIKYSPQNLLENLCPI